MNKNDFIEKLDETIQPHDFKQSVADRFKVIEDAVIEMMEKSDE